MTYETVQEFGLFWDRLMIRFYVWRPRDLSVIWVPDNGSIWHTFIVEVFFFFLSKDKSNMSEFLWINSFIRNKNKSNKFFLNDEYIWDATY